LGSRINHVFEKQNPAFIEQISRLPWWLNLPRLSNKNAPGDTEMRSTLIPRIAQFMSGMSIAIAFCMTTSASAAQTPNFPDKPVRLIVGFPPGGGVDVAARTFANVLTKQLGQPVVVENLAGAGGNIATDRVVKSAADGYTLLFGSIATAINPTLYKSLPFDAAKQLKAVSMVSTSPFVLLAHPESGMNSVGDVVEKAKTGIVNYASAGNGSGSHLFMQQFSNSAGVKMEHIPYRGAAPALNDVLGNRVPLVFDSVMTTLPMIESGKLKALGLSSKKKSTAAPNIPTLQELGIEGMDSTSWFIIFASAQTDPAILESLNAAIARAQADEGLRRAFSGMGAEMAPATPAQAQAFYNAELGKWAEVVKSANVQVD
jgi:tripartite-type tricarboxylate transporter receptor subunit TctC